MGKLVWKNNSSGWGDNEAIKGSQLKTKNFILKVHHHIDFPKDTWLMTCWPMFECVELASKDINEAKCQAKAKLTAVLEEEFKSLTGELKEVSDGI